jgi:hypothetical protein
VAQDHDQRYAQVLDRVLDAAERRLIDRLSMIVPSGSGFVRVAAQRCAGLARGAVPNRSVSSRSPSSV